MSNSDLLTLLPEVQLSFDMRSAVSDLFGEAGVLYWTADAYIDVSLEETDVPDEPGVALARSESTVVIARFEGRVIDPEHIQDITAAIDDEVDYGHYLPMFDLDGDLIEDLDTVIEPFGNRIVLFNRAELAPSWRGLGGVGRLLAGYVLRWVGGDARVIAGQPYPYQFRNDAKSKEDAESDPDFPGALAQVRHVWTSLGFVHWAHDIWFLDPAHKHLNDAIEGLEERLLAGR